MVGPLGEVQVMDWGLAKVLDPNATTVLTGHEGTVAFFTSIESDRDDSDATSIGSDLGTPAYMSPEQARGKSHECDGRSDVYSLGVVLYELLTHELPFRGDIHMLVHQVVHDEPPGLRRLRRNVPRDLETICLKCLEKTPSRRYSSAADVAADVHRFLSGEPTRARPVGALGRAARWCRRKPAIAASAAVIFGLLVLIASGAAWSYLHERALRQRQDRLLRFINHTGDMRGHRDAVEAADKELAQGPTAIELGASGDLKAWPTLQEWAMERYSTDEKEEARRRCSLGLCSTRREHRLPAARRRRTQRILAATMPGGRTFTAGRGTCPLASGLCPASTSFGRTFPPILRRNIPSNGWSPFRHPSCGTGSS